MRIDKYLWCVRYYKTRTLARVACKKGRVRINNDIPSSRIGARLVDVYRTGTTPREQFESRELLKYSKDYYRSKGVGRPTKKDRRDIDDFNTEKE